MEIVSAKYIISSETYKQCPKTDKPEYAFIGRSNVGKSSLINMLTNKKNLAKTSATPGKTQLINHFEIISTYSASTSKGKNIKWFLADLPGYGYAAVSQSKRRNWGNMIESYIRKRENLVTLFVLVDSRHSPQAIDLDFINQLGEWQIPFALLFTKSDKNKPGATVRNVDLFMNTLSKNWVELPVHFISSAISREGREKILEYISTLNKNFSQ